MLYQLHWQFKNGTTEMKAQKEINATEEMRAFIKETQESHPLPDKAIWMACNEKSKHFVFTTTNNPPNL